MGMGFEYWEVGFGKKLGWEMGLVPPPFRTLLLHHYRNNRSKSRIIEGLLFVLRQLLAPVYASVDTACRAWGFLTFDEAFGIFKSFFYHEVEKDQFQDHLLHPEYGLRVNVATVKLKR